MDQLLYNGDIITMENEDDYPEAVLIRDGKIVAVGKLSDLQYLTTPDCLSMDLQGYTLMPSFIDTNGHFSLTMQQMSMVDLSLAESFEDIVQLLKEFQFKRSSDEQDQPLFGYSYDHNYLKEKAHPTKEILDLVSTDIPIFIMHTSNHMGVVNSKALTILHISLDTLDPPNGRIGRAENTNEPNGYLEEAAILPTRKLFDQAKYNYEALALDAEMEYISRGVTTIQDTIARPNMIDMYRHLASKKLLITDIISYPVFGCDNNIVSLLKANTDCMNSYVNHFKIGGYKLILDGAPQGKAAWLTAPYENSGQHCGYPWMDDTTVEKYTQLIIDSNFQLLAHCNGDAAADQFLSIYEKALAQSTNSQKYKLRPVITNCQIIRDDQLDKMKKLNMLPSFFVAHVNYWGDIHLHNLGQNRGSRISPVHSALDRNLIFNFHTDTPVVIPDIFHTIWTAVNRITVNGVQCGTEQCIDTYNALKAVTINAAYEYNEENIKGSISPGKHADLIIIDNNPLKVDPTELSDIQILATFKDGKLLYKK